MNEIIEVLNHEVIKGLATMYGAYLLLKGFGFLFRGFNINYNKHYYYNEKKGGDE